jgi:hypothetical protein
MYMKLCGLLQLIVGMFKGIKDVYIYKLSPYIYFCCYFLHLRFVHRYDVAVEYLVCSRRVNI